MLMNGKVVGILHSALVSSGEDPRDDDVSHGAFQLMSSFANAINE